MLQRKLLVILGSLVLLLLVTAFTAILLLNGLLSELSGLSEAALDRTDRTTRLSATITRIEAELNQLRLREETHLDELVTAIEDLDAQTVVLEASPSLAGEAGRLRAMLPDFTQTVGDLATAADPASLRAYTEDALRSTAAIRSAVTEIGRAAQSQTSAAHATITTRFRWTVLGMGLVFLAVINLSILVLLRAASMVLRPVDQLVEASRRLAREEFDHRLGLQRPDEFGELARAYDHLAEQLQRNEKRKIETLHQVACTLNHELNNAISIIEIQLQLVARRGRDEPDLADRLREIHAALARMSETVTALKHVRRIVLTDYVDGVKMLDLPRSVAAAPATPTAVAGLETRSP